MHEMWDQQLLFVKNFCVVRNAIKGHGLGDILGTILGARNGEEINLNGMVMLKLALLSPSGYSMYYQFYHT